jgi:hypothetical protein
MVSPAPPAPAPSNARLLAPLAPAFHILNWIAFFGWSHVLYQVISFYYYSWLYHSKKDDADDGRAQLLQLLLQETKYTLILLEGICVVEVGRIFFKDLPGNLTCKGQFDDDTLCGNINPPPPALHVPHTFY